VFCLAEVVNPVFGKMAGASGVVILDVCQNNYLKCAENETIKTASCKRKGCFGCFGWIRFLKRKKVSTMQTI
jgi:hypothetical protein